MKLFAYIVEDEQNHFEAIKEVLNEMEEVIVVNPDLLADPYPYDKAVAQIKDLRPNLLIIDHDLNEGVDRTGYDLFLEVKSVRSFAVFCSQKPEARENDGEFNNAKFVQKFFDGSTTNIQKTVNKEKLRLHLERVAKAARNYFANYPAARRLTFRVAGENFICNVSDIAFLEANVTYCIIYFDKPNIPSMRVNDSLGDFFKKNQLGDHGFFSISRKHIINPDKISSVKSNKDNRSKTKYTIMLTTGDHLPVSKTTYETGRFMDAFLSIFKK